jgi:hypothetical protein
MLVKHRSVTRHDDEPPGQRRRVGHYWSTSSARAIPGRQTANALRQLWRPDEVAPTGTILDGDPLRARAPVGHDRGMDAERACAELAIVGTRLALSSGLPLLGIVDQVHGALLDGVGAINGFDASELSGPTSAADMEQLPVLVHDELPDRIGLEQAAHTGSGGSATLALALANRDARDHLRSPVVRLVSRGCERRAPSG